MLAYLLLEMECRQLVSHGKCECFHLVLYVRDNEKLKLL